MTSSSAATPPASGSPMDLIGKTVRWEDEGEWFTALVTDQHPSRTHVIWIGKVVDPGNFYPSDPFEPGATVVMHHGACTVIDSEPDTQDPECE